MDRAGRRSGHAGLGDAEAGGRTREQLSAGVGRRRRDPRTLFVHRPRPRPDLAMLRRCSRDRSRTGFVRRRRLVRPLPESREEAGALASLRAVVAESRIELPLGLPPMSAGLFGYIGYDMVRLIERLPDANPDVLGLPDGMFLRPTVICCLRQHRGQAHDRHAGPAGAAGSSPRTPLPKRASAWPALSPTSRRIPSARRGPGPRRRTSPRTPLSNVTRADYHAHRRAGEGVHLRRRHLSGGAVAALPGAVRPAAVLRCTARCAGSTRRRSCSSSPSTALPWSAPARRSWCGCATAG